MLARITRNVICTLLLSLVVVSSANAQKLDGLFGPMPGHQTVQPSDQPVHTADRQLVQTTTPQLRETGYRQDRQQMYTTTLNVNVIGDWYREFPQEDGATTSIGYTFRDNGSVNVTLRTIQRDGSSQIEQHAGQFSVEGNRLSIHFGDGSQIGFEVAVQNNEIAFITDDNVVVLDRNIERPAQVETQRPSAPRTNIPPATQPRSFTSPDYSAPSDMPATQPAVNNQLVGAWGLEHDLGNGKTLKMAVAFGGQGECSLGTVVFQNGRQVEREDLNGNYRVNGNRIMASWEDGTSEEATFTISGRSLQLNIEGQAFYFTALN
ncbi:MAG: lipocalin family protein [Planctomycetota bacterium]